MTALPRAPSPTAEPISQDPAFACFDISLTQFVLATDRCGLVETIGAQTYPGNCQSKTSKKLDHGLAHLSSFCTQPGKAGRPGRLLVIQLEPLLDAGEGESTSIPFQKATRPLMRRASGDGCR